MKKLIYIAGWVGALLLVGCELVELDSPPISDEGNNPGRIVGPTSVPQQEDAFLAFLHGDTQKTWRATGFTIFGISGFQPCRLDDTITLRADGTFAYDGGEQLCGAEDNQALKSGTWQKVPDENTLVFEEGDNRYTATVNGLSADGIVLSGRYIGLDIRGAYDTVD